MMIYLFIGRNVKLARMFRWFACVTLEGNKICGSLGNWSEIVCIWLHWINPWFMWQNVIVFNEGYNYLNLLRFEYYMFICIYHYKEINLITKYIMMKWIFYNAILLVRLRNFYLCCRIYLFHWNSYLISTSDYTFTNMK